MRKLTGQQSNTPVISLRREGGSFEGIMTAGPKEVKLRKGKGYVYEFTLLDINGLDVQEKINGKYVEAQVEEGATVAVFAPTVLHSALSQSSHGKQIKVTYLGKEASKNGGNDYHNFDVVEI
jgi:hypothetical protein